MLKYDKKRRKFQIQILFLHIIIYLLLIFGITGIAHQYCPMATVCFGCLNVGQSLGNWMFPGAIILGIVIFVLTMFIGRQFCGLICPFGTIQDLVFTLNKKAKNRHYKELIPLKLHNVLKWIKYVILLWMVVTAFLGLNYLYMPACPVMSLGHIQSITIFGVISLAIIFIGGLCIERIWCLYFCPYGALLNISQWIGKILHIPRRKIKWSKDCCIDCFLCNDYCPMRIDVQKSDKVEDVECIHCKRCALCCPGLKIKEKEKEKEK